MQTGATAPNTTAPSVWAALDAAGRRRALLHAGLGGVATGFLFYAAPEHPGRLDWLAWLLLALAGVGLALAAWDWRRYLVPGACAAALLVPIGVSAAGGNWPGGVGLGLAGAVVGVVAGCVGVWWALGHEPLPTVADPARAAGGVKTAEPGAAPDPRLKAGGGC